MIHSPKKLRCPRCGELFDQDATQAMPFCSKRCRLLDLGGWLSEEHSVPHEPDPEAYEEYPEEEL